jgi:NAD+ synthase
LIPSELLLKTPAFIEDTGTKGAVVGLSGGVDSALVAHLGKLALGEKIQALVMPEIGVTWEQDIEHAKEFARTLSIPFKVIELNDVLDAVRQTYPDLLLNGGGFLARANLAPRTRMLFCYAHSNLEDLIVLGTGNKTELLLGYFTKFGDGGVDFLPIGDLYKTQVLQLARYLKIPERIVNKPPSAGLWNGQTDEEEIGMSYEKIDRILFQLYDRGLSVEAAASELKINIQTVEKMSIMVEKNAHKRLPPKTVKL